MSPLVVALTAAVSMAGCQGDSSPRNPALPSASPLTAKAVTPLGDGEFILFERLVPGEEDPELLVVRPGGGKAQLVRSPGGYPHWSPDGSTVAIGACLNAPDCSTGVALIERSTGKVHGFAMPDPGLSTFCAVWAPSGKRLACEANSETDRQRNGIYSVRVSDGNGLMRITRNPDGDDAPLAYSPDGRQLLIDRAPPPGGDEVKHALFVTPADGTGKPRRITPWGLTDDVASWSPDGNTIVFGTDGDLYQVKPDGTGLAKIRLEMLDGSSATQAFDVTFSPDGRQIAFSMGGAVPGIYLADADGSHAERVTTSPTEDHHASWGPRSGA